MTERAWFTRAVCRGVEEETLTATNDTARRVCAGCPVKVSCLDEAMAEEGRKPASYRYGVRGGLTPLDRERVARGIPLPTPRVSTPPPPVTHGHSGYQNRGCRCDVCRSAQAEYQRGYRQRRAARRKAAAAAAAGEQP